jgi:signal transduction histidine kinase
MEQTSLAPAERLGKYSTAALRNCAAELSARLLLLAAIIVMAAETAIFLPTVADLNRDWLTQRLNAAWTASLALEASGGAHLPEQLQQDLLRSSGVRAISVTLPGSRRLVLGMLDSIQAARVYDLRTASLFTFMTGGMEALAASPGRLIRAVAPADALPGGGDIDIVIDETPLRDALWRRAGAIFLYTLFIVPITVLLAYTALKRFLIHPVDRIARNIAFYRENPEDAARVISPSGRGAGIGAAEKELAALQSQLTERLREKARLANVGLAVSKINHDLRNMLAGAQLVSDRLAGVSDPTVQRLVPRLTSALDRAIALCSNTIDYGRSEEAPPKQAPFALRPLIAEVSESLGAEDLNGIKVQISVPAGLELFADRDQIFRVLFNLMHYALEAFREVDEPPEQQILNITALREGGFAIIRVSDNGPGIPPLIRPNLFKAFQVGAGAGGDRLGLAIGAEIVRAHGGNIVLDDAATGTTFVVRLPAAVHDPARILSAEDGIDGKLAQDSFSR